MDSLKAKEQELLIMKSIALSLANELERKLLDNILLTKNSNESNYQKLKDNFYENFYNVMYLEEVINNTKKILDREELIKNNLNNSLKLNSSIAIKNISLYTKEIICTYSGLSLGILLSNNSPLEMTKKLLLLLIIFLSTYNANLLYIDSNLRKDKIKNKINSIEKNILISKLKLHIYKRMLISYEEILKIQSNKLLTLDIEGKDIIEDKIKRRKKWLILL